MILIIKDGTKSIDPYQYAKRDDIKELIIADTVEVIGDGAFSGCTNLEKITWGSSIHTIGRDAFSRCISLESLHLPDSLKWVGGDAFASSGLTYVEFEDNDDVYIENGAFAFCTRLTCAILPNGLNDICGGTFLGCTKLEDVFIPGTVKSIGMMAFDEAAAEEIELPNSIETIYHFAFNKSKLIRIVVPNSVLEIRQSAFGHCSDLRSVDIGKSVECIGRKAFEDCLALTDVTFTRSVIKYIEDGIFDNCTNLKRINVPASAIDTYKRLLPKDLHKKLVGF